MCGWAGARQGIALNVAVRGKQQPPWCRDSRIDDSDGVQLWIDTRNTQNIHRAGRFCHRFAFLPIGAGRRLDEPVAVLLAINRAKESPREIEPRHAENPQPSGWPDGYSLEGFIPAAALTGFSPADQPALGFTLRRDRPRAGLADVQRRPGAAVRRRPQPVGHARPGAVSRIADQRRGTGAAPGTGIPRPRGVGVPAET